MRVLHISAHFYPNIGGVETHLIDLINALIKRKWKVYVLSYMPLTTKTNGKIFEVFNKCKIIRIPWIPNLFLKLVKFPILEFLYLAPGLFIFAPFIILISKPKVIHAHGLVVGFIGVFWAKVFNKRVVISTHNTYRFPKRGIYRIFARWIFGHCDFCLVLSDKSKQELESIGVPKNNISRFTYWIDLNNFKPVKNAKKLLGWKDRFIVLFVGRLIEEKGVSQLIESFRNWDRRIYLVMIGAGPSKKKLVNIKLKNFTFLEEIRQKDLPWYYSGADVLIVPSISEEGFGRVILESLACGTPVIGADRGAIPEAINETVGKLINSSPINIKKVVEFFYNSPDKLRELSVNCRKYAIKKYSEKNAEQIIKKY